MQSERAPRWRIFLQKHAKFLFKKCPDKDGEEMDNGNYHWRWDDGCICHGRPVRGWNE